MTETDNIFGDCENIDEILFLVNHYGGSAALAELLNYAVDNKLVYREDLEGAADSFDGASQPLAVDLIREAADQAESEASVKIAAILSDPNIANQKARLASLYRRGEVPLEAAKGMDTDVLEYVANSVHVRRRRVDRD